MSLVLEQSLAPNTYQKIELSSCAYISTYQEVQGRESVQQSGPPLVAGDFKMHGSQMTTRLIDFHVYKGFATDYKSQKGTTERIW